MSARAQAVLLKMDTSMSKEALQGPTGASGEMLSPPTIMHGWPACPLHSGKGRALVIDGCAVGDAADLHMVQQRRHKGRAVVQVRLDVATGVSCRYIGEGAAGGRAPHHLRACNGHASGMRALQ